MKKLLLISAAAWLAGLVTYVLALRFFSDQGLGAGDLRAVLFTSAIGVAVTVALVYAPALFLLRRRLKGRSRWLYPVVSILLGVLPVMLIVRFWGGDFAAMASAEAMMFYCMFAAFGAVFGIGFARMYGREIT
jgi:hypothetical protein